MKKKSIVTFLLLLSIGCAFAQSETDDFSGKWKTPDGIIVEIFKAANAFTGITQDQKFMILKDVKFTKGQWKGTIIRPSDGTKADCTLVKIGSELRIVATKGIFTKKLTWTKV